MLNLDVTTAGPTATITVVGEIDLSSSAELATSLDEARATGAEQVELDFAGVTFLDSFGLRTLIEAHTQAPIIIVGTPPNIRRIFDIVGLSEVLGLDPA